VGPRGRKGGGIASAEPRARSGKFSGRQNWEGFFGCLGARNFAVAALSQKHSATVYVVQQGRGSQGLCYELPGRPCSTSRDVRADPPGDALITNQPGILLTVGVADCMPILLADKERHVIAAVHAGWRGALSRIAEKTVGEMRRMFGVWPENLSAAIGPSIRTCCYEVGEEVADAFLGRFAGGEKFFRTPPPRPGECAMAQRYQVLFTLQAPPGHGSNTSRKVHLDLVAVARYQLRQAGVPDSRIYVADYCTACRNDLFFSYRMEGMLAGRMVAAIGIKTGQAD
jgi:YfiH family protein